MVSFDLAFSIGFGHGLHIPCTEDMVTPVAKSDHKYKALFVCAGAPRPSMTLLELGTITITCEIHLE